MSQATNRITAGPDSVSAIPELRTPMTPTRAMTISQKSSRISRGEITRARRPRLGSVRVHGLAADHDPGHGRADHFVRLCGQSSGAGSVVASPSMVCRTARQVVAITPATGTTRNMPDDARQGVADRHRQEDDRRMQADGLAVDERGDEVALDDVEHDRVDEHDDDVGRVADRDRDEERQDRSR